MRILYLIFYTILPLLFSGHAKAEEPSACVLCQDYFKDYKKYKTQTIEARKHLDEQKKILLSLGPESDAKKMAITSQIFVLSAKIETGENWTTVLQDKINSNCNNCPGTPQ